MRGRSSERGAVAGAESLALGTLILIGGVLLVTNAWAVIDSRLALDAAAREYLRSYTQASSPSEAAEGGLRAVDEVLADRPRLAADTRVVAPDPSGFGPCSPAVVELRSRVPTVNMPFLDGFAPVTVRVRHVELVDAHREMAEVGPSYSVFDTACGG